MSNDDRETMYETLKDARESFLDQIKDEIQDYIDGLDVEEIDLYFDEDTAETRNFDSVSMLEEAKRWIGQPHDMISECADSGVPVYTGSLLELAADDYSLAVDSPEIGPAFDGSPSPVNIIAANVYERIEQELWEVWGQLEDYFEIDVWYPPTVPALWQTYMPELVHPIKLFVRIAQI